MTGTTTLHTFATTLKLTIVIPLGIMMTLAGFSLTISWNLFTTFLFWFILMPLVAFGTARALRLKKIWHTAVAMACFYGWFLFLTYKHYASDYYVVVTASFLYNSLIMCVANLTTRAQKN